MWLLSKRPQCTHLSNRAQLELYCGYKSMNFESMIRYRSELAIVVNQDSATNVKIKINRQENLSVNDELFRRKPNILN